MREGKTESEGLPEDLPEEIEDNDDDLDVDVEDDPEYEGPENAKETVKRVIKEAKEKAARDESTEKGAQQKEAKPDKSVKKTDAKEAPQQPKPVSAPTRLTSEAKEVFKKLPPELQAEWARIAKDEERKFTQTQQQAAAAQKEASHVVEAVRPYLLSHPELMELGYTESRLVSELIATHKVLTDSENPVNAIQRWLQIGTQMGVDDDTIQDIWQKYQGQGGVMPQVQAAPEFNALREDLNSIKSWIGQAQSAQHDAAVTSIVSELEAIRNERNDQGEFLYPEMFDDSFLDSAKPLVSGLVGTVPGISYGEAFKRVYFSLTGKSPTGNPNQQKQTKLPANNNIQEKAVKAAVSVRGKSAPSTPGEMADVPPEALRSAKDSVRWAINQLRRG